MSNLCQHLAKYKNPAVEVIDLEQAVDRLVNLAGQKTYIDDPVLVTVKALKAANRLKQPETVDG